MHDGIVVGLEPCVRQVRSDQLAIGLTRCGRFSVIRT